MTIQELEKQLLTLAPDEKRRLIQLLTQSLATETTSASAAQETESLVEFFRNSPLCEVADQLDLTRDRSLIPDRVQL